jgi:hypothetical protein
MGMYEGNGCWAGWTFDDERSYEGKSSGSITISNKANKELGDDALEGLICNEASRIVLYHLALMIDPSVYHQIRELAPAEELFRFNAVQRVLFDIDKVIPLISETGNIDNRNHWGAREVWIQNFSKYLNALNETMPEIAAEIVKRIEFADELRLDAQL